MNITAIRQAVAEAISAVSGLRAYHYPLDQPPAGESDVATVDIDDEGINYQEAFRGGTAMLYLLVEVSVQMSNERSATERLDALLSSGTGETRSVIDALAANRTLGGLTGGLVVTTASRPRVEGDGIGSPRRLVSTLSIRIPVGRL